MSIPSNAPAGANAPAMPNSETALALAPSTVIPALGLTFVQAEDRITAGLLASTDHLSVKESDAHSEEIADIAQRVHETAPSTLTDATVKLRVVAGPVGFEGGYSPSFTESVRQVAEFLERFHGGLDGSG